MSGGVRRLRALVIKESLQVVRDPSSIIIAFVLPLVLLFLFGYGVSLDLEGVALGVVLEDDSPEARSLADAFTRSRYFDVTLARHRRVLEDALVAGRLRGLVVIPAYFDQRHRAGRGRTAVQVIADGSEPNTASFVQHYAAGVWRNWSQQQARAAGVDPAPAAALHARHWFNAELSSRHYLVPGSVAVIMTVIGTLLTALVIAREWERGTMEAMLATPVSAGEMLASKILPYFLLGLGSMGLSALTAVFVFDVPFRGSLAGLAAIAAAFLCPALGQGLLISAVARNQFVASQLAVFSGFLPAMLLSGFIFEIPSMPEPIQWLTRIVHARYFVASLQTVFLSGDVWPLLARNIAAMLTIGAVFFMLAMRNTGKRIA